MKTHSLKERILSRFRSNYLKGRHGFVNSQVIQDYIHENVTRPDGAGYKHETIGRLLRKMAEEGLLESKIMEGKHVDSVAYAYIPSGNEKLSVSFRKTM